MIDFDDRCEGPVNMKSDNFLNQVSYKTMKNSMNSKFLAALVFVLFVFPVFVLNADSADENRNAVQTISVKRCDNNPLITFASSPILGNNINGPSVIRVPGWVKKPLGKYYMYFAHHKGKYIRLAYADDLSGPWNIYETGVLHLNQVPIFKNHIASPDVHIDEKMKKIQMYFHGRLKAVKAQKTLMADSEDGLLFKPDNKILGMFYFRVFKWGEYFYAIDAGGSLNRSGLTDKEWHKREKKLIAPVTVDDEYGRRINVRIRHSAVMVKDGLLYLFYTRKEDAPERILLSTIVLTEDWNQWTASEPIDVIRPREKYEGIQYPLRPSEGGRAINVHQIRDPYVFKENGKHYLFYSIAGEMGIAMAEITIKLKKDIGLILH